jgi:hypothetical protein
LIVAPWQSGQVYVLNINHIHLNPDDVNLIDDIRTIERNADVLLNACKDIGLAENTGKTKYIEAGL